MGLCKSRIDDKPGDRNSGSLRSPAAGSVGMTKNDTKGTTKVRIVHLTQVATIAGDATRNDPRSPAHLLVGVSHGGLIRSHCGQRDTP